MPRWRVTVFVPGKPGDTSIHDDEDAAKGVFADLIKKLLAIPGMVLQKMLESKAFFRDGTRVYIDGGEE